MDAAFGEQTLAIKCTKERCLRRFSMRPFFALGLGEHRLLTLRAMSRAAGRGERVRQNRLKPSPPLWTITTATTRSVDRDDDVFAVADVSGDD